MTDIAILSTGHHAVDARLQRLSTALAEAGLSVELRALGTGAAGQHPAAVVLLAPAGRGRRLLRALRLPLTVGRRARALAVVDPELILPALLWRRLTGGRLVVDVHEDYRKLLRDRSWATGVARHAARTLVGIALRGAARADLTVVADEQVPPLAARYRLVVRNLPRPGDLPEPTEPGTTPRALYVGDVRRSRGLARMMEGVLAVPPWELDVVGPVAADDQRWVRERLRAAGEDARRVRLHGRLPLAEAWRFAEGAWVGLALLDSTPAFREALPTKLHEYLVAGLPVLASPLPRVADLVRDSGAGLIAADQAEVVAALRRWLNEPGLLRQHRAAALAWSSASRGPDPFSLFAATLVDLLEGAARGRDHLAQRAG